MPTITYWITDQHHNTNKKNKNPDSLVILTFIELSQNIAESMIVVSMLSSLQLNWTVKELKMCYLSKKTNPSHKRLHWQLLKYKILIHLCKLDRQSIKQK